MKLKLIFISAVLVLSSCSTVGKKVNSKGSKSNNAVDRLQELYGK